MKHSVACPECKTLYKDDFEINTIDIEGKCSNCVAEQNEDELYANEEPNREEYHSQFEI